MYENNLDLFNSCQLLNFFCCIFSTKLLLYSENLNSVTLAIAAIFLLSKKAGLFSKYTPSGSWCIQK